MPSPVTHANAALALIGADAVVTSIDPSDGSAEAGHCKRFFALARRSLLEKGSWTFAKTRATLALLSTNPSTRWTYAYAMPSNCIRPLRVLTAGVSSVFQVYNPNIGVLPNEEDSAPFEVEAGVLLTNEEDAELIYIRDVTDTTLFTPTFDEAFDMLLASYLCGPIIKGKEGAAAAAEWRKMAFDTAAAGAALDANSSARSNDTALPVAQVRA